MSTLPAGEPQPAASEARPAAPGASAGGPGGAGLGNALARFTTTRPVAVLVVVAAALVFGWFSLQQLPVALMPELSYPTLTVRTEYAGAAPEEVENDVSRPIEEALGVIGGLRRISSVSRAGVSDVVLEFSWDIDMSEAAQETLEKLDLVFLPEDAERPLILRYDPSLDPVMELSLSGTGDRFAGEEGLRRLRRLADREVKRALEPIKGVAAVRVRGGLEEEIHVRLDEEKLRRSGLPIEAVIQRLAQENVNVAGGTILEGRTEYMVRTLNEYEDLAQIADTVVSNVEGREVRIKDLGEVAWSHRERQIETRTDGGPSVQIDIFKEADANIVALARRVEERLGEVESEEAAAEKRAEAAPRGKGRAGDAGQKPAGLAAELFANEGAALKIVADRSVFIESSIRELRDAALWGGLLAIAVLFAFLRNVRTTLIVAVSIPIGLVIGFAPLQLLGVSLNIMSLGGLALGVGMLVDSSIVVLESIFRCREEGDGLVAAARRGTAEVQGAVVASTLTSVAVFFPMVFVEGIAGQAFGDLGIAVVVSQFASLAVAVFFVPMLASRQGWRWGAKAADGAAPAEAGRSPWRFGSFAAYRADLAGFLRWAPGKGRGGLRRAAAVAGKLLLALPALLYLHLRLVLASVVEVLAKLFLLLFVGAVLLGRRILGLVRTVGRPFARLFARAEREIGPAPGRPSPLARLSRSYELAVRWAVVNPGAMVGATLAIFAVTVWATMQLDSELLPEVHQGEVTVEVALPVGTPLEQTEAILGPVEGAILAEREHLRAVILTLGFEPETSQRSDEGEHTARFKLLLDSSDPGTEDEVVARVRGLLAEVPDLEARVTRPVLFSAKTPIEVEIYGDDLPRLRRAAADAREVMASLPELADVEATLKSGAPEVQVVYDRDLLTRYGLNLRSVATLVRDQVKGFEASRFNLKDRRIPIIVRLPERDRETVADVSELMINPGAPRPIPLAAVARVSLGEGPSEVRRIDSARVAVVGANIAQGSLGSAVARIDQALSERMSWPADMTFFIAGQNEEWQRSRGSLLLALGLSLFLVYVIMAAQFESLLQPLVIMFSVPLAFFGTALTLLALDVSLSVVVFLGAILLGGIVVNNAIVLVDYVNVLRGRGLSREDALVTAGLVRMRPILMTTATSVLGLLPMAFGLGDGAEIRTPMAIAVASGLTTSTALTLLIIPSLYALADRAKERLFGRGSVEAASPAGGTEPPALPAGAPAAALPAVRPEYT